LNGTFPIFNDVMKLTFRGDMENGLWNWCSDFGVETRNKGRDKSVIIIFNFLKVVLWVLVDYIDFNIQKMKGRKSKSRDVKKFQGEKVTLKVGEENRSRMCDFFQCLLEFLWCPWVLGTSRTLALLTKVLNLGREVVHMKCRWISVNVVKYIQL